MTAQGSRGSRLPLWVGLASLLLPGGGQLLLGAWFRGALWLSAWLAAALVIGHGHAWQAMAVMVFSAGDAYLLGRAVEARPDA